MKTVSACTLDCPDGCSLVVDVENDHVISISGNPEHPFTAGCVCAKIRDFSKRLRRPDRITTPLLRDGSGWKRIDWATALDICAERIQSYRSEPESILHIQTGADAGVLAWLNRVFFAKLGASKAEGSLCNIAGREACIMDFGDVDANDISDLAQARNIVNWGRDLSRTSIHSAMAVTQARQQGARVITISAGGDGNRKFSDAVIAVRPGTDRFLAAAIIRLLIERDRIPSEVLAHTAGWEEFCDCVMAWPLSKLSEACGVAIADIENLFELYTQSEPVATLIGWGLQRHPYGGENVRFINAVALLAGHVGRAGGGSHYKLPQNRDLDMAWAREAELPSPRKILLPTIARDIMEAKDPPIRMIWVTASNIVNQAPDSQGIARAFAATEFKVVVDAFMTDTAERADLILPCALMLEKEDLVGSSLSNLISYVRPVFASPGEARSDHWILSELGKRLDPPVILPDAQDCLRQSLNSPYLNVTLEQLRETGFVEAPRPKVAFADMRFGHSDGKYHFPAGLHNEPPAPTEYPLRLLSLLRREAIHSQIPPEKQTIPPVVWIAPDDPELERIDLEQDVFLVSPLGRLRVIPQIDPDLPAGVVIYRRGDWMKLGGGVNQTIEAGLTDIGGGAPFYQQYARLEN